MHLIEVHRNLGDIAFRVKTSLNIAIITGTRTAQRKSYISEVANWGVTIMKRNQDLRTAWRKRLGNSLRYIALQPRQRRPYGPVTINIPPSWSCRDGVKLSGLLQMQPSPHLEITTSLVLASSCCLLDRYVRGVHIQGFVH